MGHVSAQGVSASVGARGNRLPRVAGCVLEALRAAVVAGGLGVVLVPMGLTLPWLVTLCGLVLVLRLATGLHRAVRSIGLLDLELGREPHLLVLRGPWATRRHALDEVTAVQLWRDPRPRLEVLLYNGSSVQVEPGRTFPADVAVLLRELLEPHGVKVVDWGGPDADRR